MNEATEIGVAAAGSLIEFGVIGAVLVLSILLNLLLGWLLWLARDPYPDHMETHYDNLG